MHSKLGGRVSSGKEKGKNARGKIYLKTEHYWLGSSDGLGRVLTENKVSGVLLH
jgi:hypothetical protein